MKTIGIWASAFIALGVVNTMIVGKEQTLAGGQSVLLKLAPVDPRSLMQGDYMVLRYEVAREARDRPLQATGRIVLRLDPDRVGKFVRLDDGSPLAEDEILLRYRKRRGLRLGAEAFFFEEGSASTYEPADYGELKVTPSGESVLVGLRDKDFNPL